MATGGDITKSAVQEEGSKPSGQDYYNIMLIGTTGKGKSTTADKLLIANPTQHAYEAGLPQREPVLNEEDRQLKMDDITMWLLHASKVAPDNAMQGKVMEQDNLQIAQTRIKCLVYFRNKVDPHKEVNKARSTGMNIFSSTKECEVLSNETSKVRIVDVPGFFDKASLVLQRHGPESSLQNLEVNNLDIMRRIVRIQTTLGMKFHRILYFLPSRGPLERADAHLKLELEWMMHYFGKYIFQCLVLVATVPYYISEDEDYPEHKKFPEKAVEGSRILFKEALTEVFSSIPDDPVPDPPLIFISMTDSCERILEKVKSAYNTDVSLNLEFNPTTCTHCGIKVGVVKGQKVTCHFNTDTIPYEESTCHPKLVAKYSRANKVWGEFKHVMLFKWVKNPWPVFTDEVCAHCKGSPDTRGCMQVGSKCQLKIKKQIEMIVVDHTNQFDDNEIVIIEGETELNDAPDNQAHGEEGVNHNEPSRDASGQNEVQQSTRLADTADQHRLIGEENSSVNTVSGLEANTARLDIHSHHTPPQQYPVESANPCFDVKGT